MVLKTDAGEYFFEIELDTTASPPRVIRRSGRVGSKGKIESGSFPTEKTAKIIFSKLVSSKKKKGYVEVSSSNMVNGVLITDKPTQKTGAAVEDKKGMFSKPEVVIPKEVKLPKNWKNVRERLSINEIHIYETYDDNRTKERRISLSKKFDSMFNESQDDDGIINLRDTMWRLLRAASIKYLMELHLYGNNENALLKESIKEIEKEIKDSSAEERKYINKYLKSIISSTVKGGFTVRQAEKSISEFFDHMMKTARQREKNGFAGTSKRRIRLLTEKTSR